jgi:hypothetical protein
MPGSRPGARSSSSSKGRQTDPASGRPCLAVVPEIDCSYRNFASAWQEFYDVIHKRYVDAFDTATADELARYPLINSGVFAMRAGAPHWQAWADTLEAALQQTTSSPVEQAAINYVVYRQKLPAAFPWSWCNWICHHAAPRRDPASGRLTEPLLPYQRRGIAHRRCGLRRNTGDLHRVDGNYSFPKT